MYSFTASDIYTKTCFKVNCIFPFLGFKWVANLLVYCEIGSLDISPILVVLVSLLVDQLSSLFLIFFGQPKKNLSSLRSFLFTLLNFLSSLFQKMRNWPDNWSAKRLTKTTFSKKTGQKIQESEQKRSETGQIFFWSTKKKWEIDRTIGRPKDWPKPHGRD